MGTVKRPPNGAGDKTVKLTATITSGEVSATVEFTIIVLEQSPVSNTQLSNDGPISNNNNDNNTSIESIPDVVAAPPLTGSWENPYVDVPDTAWFYEATRFVTEKGLMEGTSADIFSPGVFLNRAMMVTILYRQEGKPEVIGGIPFQDVSEGEWYSDAILWASENDIVLGYGNGNFGPNDLVTREQAVSILYRFAKGKGLDVSATADLSEFTDTDGISGWAVDAMKWAVSVGIIQGQPGNKIASGGTCTRTEIATIFKRYIEDFFQLSY
jgi:hypothetical protein